jgi:crotonobetainyl-CoA hydratase
MTETGASMTTIDGLVDHVRISTSGHLLHITLERPAARNAINAAMSRRLAGALDRAEADPAVRCVLWSAQGTTFSAGADLAGLATGDLPLVPDRPELGFAGVVAHPTTVPMVGALDGNALGGGFEILLACDLVVASETSVFGLPEVRRGLVAAGGGAVRLASVIGHRRASELILTGEPIDAATALSWGLVNQVVPSSEVLPTAVALAHSVAAGSPVAVRASKEVMRRVEDGRFLDEADGWRLNDTVVSKRLAQSADAHEGVLAFLEKRAPIWGRPR